MQELGLHSAVKTQSIGVTEGEIQAMRRDLQKFTESPTQWHANPRSTAPSWSTHQVGDMKNNWRRDGGDSFGTVDKNKDGVIDRAEFKAWLVRS